MSDECLVSIFIEFNDRGVISDRLEKAIPIDAQSIVEGEYFPFWEFDGRAPVVEYYDGETLELSYEGKKHACRVGWEPAGIKRFLVHNGYVQESARIEIGLVSIAYHIPFDYAKAFRHGSFNALIQNFLNRQKAAVPSFAIRYFLWSVEAGENFFFLSDDTIEKLRTSAEEGNAYALYALGRYHYYIRPDSRSVSIALSAFIKAYDKGISDALAAAALMYRFGDTGIADREKADDLLMKAIEEGSCFARHIHLRDMILGSYGVAEDPESAKRMLDCMIMEDGEDPFLYQLRGWACQALSSICDAKADYAKAAELGSISSWLDRAVAFSVDEDGDIIDRRVYLEALDDGVANRSSQCLFLKALESVEDYDSVSQYEQYTRRVFLIPELERAAGMGSFSAAEMLGDIYSNGLYGIAEDDQRAYEWYLKASHLYSSSAYEKLFSMVKDGYPCAGSDSADMLALLGARLGSSRLAREVVIAYSKGRLECYRKEIEQYYVPVFDEDDGRYDAYL